MMVKWIEWGSENRGLNILIVIAYYLCVVLPHEVIGIMIANFFKNHDRAYYDKVLLIVFTIFLIGFVLGLFRAIWKNSERNRILFYLLSTVIFTSLCYYYLFVVNVEAIHFVQYGMLAILLFPLFKNYTYVLIWVTVAGMLDEFYQYDILAPGKTDYYDFNDVIIDMVGGAYGLIAVRSYSPLTHYFNFKMFIKSLHFKVLLSGLLGIIFCFALGFFTYFPSDRSIFFLQSKPIPWFWYQLPPEVVFHVIPPIEGILFIMALLFFYKHIEKESPST